MKKKILMIVGIIFIITGCTSIPGQRDRFTIHGMVYDHSNRPVGNYVIFVDGMAQGITDIGGRFTLENVELGTRLVSGHGKGYANFNDTIEIVDNRQVLYIRVPTITKLLQEALSYGKAGRIEEALSCVEDVLASDEKSREGLFGKAVLLYLAGQSQACLKVLESMDKGEGQELLKQLKENCETVMRQEGTRP